MEVTNLRVVVVNDMAFATTIERRRHGHKGLSGPARRETGESVLRRGRVRGAKFQPLLGPVAMGNGYSLRLFTKHIGSQCQADFDAVKHLGTSHAANKNSCTSFNLPL